MQENDNTPRDNSASNEKTEGRRNTDPQKYAYWKDKQSDEAVRGALLHFIHHNNIDGDKDVGAFLLIAGALAYEDDGQVRDKLFDSIKSELMQYTFGASDLISKVIFKAKQRYETAEAKKEAGAD